MNFKDYFRYTSSIFKIIFILILVFIFLRLFIVEPGVIKGYSMYPTYDNGQFFLINKFDLLFSPPQRGQVVQFLSPNGEGFLVKRIIGIPGDTIDIENGEVYITDKDGNKTKLAEPYIPIEKIESTGEDCTCGPLEDGEYFLMGDNRAQSSDSRDFGPIHRSYITGYLVF